MKSIVYTLTLTTSLVAGIVLVSCKSKKEAATVTVKDTGFKKVESPLSDKQYKSDDQHFRARGIGESQDETAARKIAFMNAKSELASLIQTTMKKVSDQYTNQRTVGKDKEYENKFEEMTREVTNLEMANMREIGTETYTNEQGLYKVYLVVEAKKDEIFQKMDSRISSDKKLQLDYDKAKFQQVFDEEMKKLAESRP
ncbi:MAG: hypothetical protein RIR05_380 [Bacteroidota bacterium]|jgi:hypothetical protein|nr:hypothetical protein [Bacteroidia bacterium]NBX19188.1 hypothetical protein [Bacteroidia bacterium]NBY09559.1 hypothetical protein [Sphingobacteriia bacterium]